jgi:hypothetical protein
MFIDHTVRALIFSTRFVRNISHYKKNWARYDEKPILIFMYSTQHSYPIWMIPEFSQQILEKLSSLKISSKSLQWETSCSMRTDGWTDMDIPTYIHTYIHTHTHTYTTQLIVAFRNFAKASWKCVTESCIGPSAGRRSSFSNPWLQSKKCIQQ